MNEFHGFDVLIGNWDIAAKHRLIDAVVSGTDTFEWLGGRFLIQRTHYDHELLPDAISVIGPPESGDGLVLEYFDVRGVRRTFAVSLEGGVLRTLREYPGFSQRLTATLGAETFEAVIQLAETPGDWRDDMKVTYRRRP
jgi:hypothetical protein